MAASAGIVAAGVGLTAPTGAQAQTTRISVPSGLCILRWNTAQAESVLSRLAPRDDFRRNIWHVTANCPEVFCDANWTRPWGRDALARLQEEDRLVVAMRGQLRARCESVASTVDDIWSDTSDSSAAFGAAAPLVFNGSVIGADGVASGPGTGGTSGDGFNDGGDTDGGDTGGGDTGGGDTGGGDTGGGDTGGGDCDGWHQCVRAYWDANDPSDIADSLRGKIKQRAMGNDVQLIPNVDFRTIQ